MLQAFLAQQPNIKENIVNYQEENYQKALLQLAKSQRFSDHMNIPTQLKDGQLDNVTEPHPNFKGYDHSCEKVRISFKKGKNISTDGSDGSDGSVGSVAEMMISMFDGDNDGE